jgi:acyl-CoA hydrolase
MSLFRPRTPRESQHETSELMMPHDANVLGHVFGGVILSMMDKAAAVAAFRHARAACVTVSIDRVDFREPIHVGDLVVMKASVNFVGRTSMEVGVRVEAEELTTGRRRHTNSCYLTFVAVDRNGRPLEVPPLAPGTPDEHRRHTAAAARRRRRLEERASERQATGDRPSAQDAHAERANGDDFMSGPAGAVPDPAADAVAGDGATPAPAAS